LVLRAKSWKILTRQSEILLERNVWKFKDLRAKYLEILAVLSERINLERTVLYPQRTVPPKTELVDGSASTREGGSHGQCAGLPAEDSGSPRDAVAAAAEENVATVGYRFN
jgi:hypothetical protein